MDSIIKSVKALPKFLIFILFLSFIINIYAIDWGLPSFYGWAADEITPARVLEGVEKGFSNGWYYKYPPVQFYLLTLFYSPLLLLHQFNVVDVYNLPTYTILFYIGRFLSIIFSVALLIAIYRCGLEIYDKKSSLFAVLITALSCTTIYYSKIANLEIPYLFWVVLSWIFYLRILKYQDIKDYLLFSITAVISVCTKDQAYAFYIITPFFIITQHYRYLKQQNKDITLIQSLCNRKIILSLLVGIGVFLLLYNVISNLEGFFKHINTITSGSGKISPRYETTIWGQFDMFRQSFTHIRFSLGWFSYVICLLGLILTLPKFKKNYLLYSLLVPIASYYLFYICLVWYNDTRYLMPVGIALAFFGGKFIGDFLNPEQNFFKPKVILVTAIFTYTLAYSFSVNLLMAQDSRYYVEQWMQENIDRKALIWNAGSEKYSPRFYNFRVEHIDEPSLNILRQKQPDYVVVSSSYDIRRFEKNTPEYEFYNQLNQEVNYKLLLNYQSQPHWNLLPWEELRYRNGNKMHIYSNFDKINPEIRIFQKRSEFD